MNVTERNINYMSNHILGVYFAPKHGRGGDRDYIRRLSPPMIRILDPDVQELADMHNLAPNAILAPRTWIIDDNNGAAVRSFMVDPIATGRDHANQYRAQLDRWYEQAQQRGLILPSASQFMFNSANEPNQGGTPERIAAYSVAFLDACTELGLRASAPCLGVGWPNNTGKDTPVDWTPYAALEPAINRGEHFLAVHEYSYKTGPKDHWLWWCGRHLQCPFDVPIVLGEIGVDNYVANDRWQQDGGPRGWHGNVDPNTFASFIEEHLRGCDDRVFAALPFITDYKNKSWASFDTFEAHDALLARKDRMVPQIKFTGHNPINVVSIEQRIMFVAARDGLNVRNAPNGDKVGAIPFAEQVAVQDTKNAGNYKWAKIGTNRWVAEDFLSTTQPEIPTEPTLDHTILLPVINNGDKFARTMNFIFKWEGGFSTDPNDPGNYVDGVFVGTKYGISAKAHKHLDIKNLTKEQAAEIYRKEYWEASGADKMPWPLCMAHMNIAVNGGVGAATLILSRSGHSFNKYMGEKIKWYTNTNNWNQYYTAWMRRCADLLIEADK